MRILEKGMKEGRVSLAVKKEIKPVITSQLNNSRHYDSRKGTLTYNALIAICSHMETKLCTALDLLQGLEKIR